MEEHDAVRRWWRRMVRAAAPCLLGCALGGVPATATAGVPPDLSGSSLTCTDANGGAFRAGDDLRCDLDAVLADGTDNGILSATTTLPVTVEPEPSSPLPQYDPGTRLVTFGPTVLGLVFSGQLRVLTFYVRLVDGVAPGSGISISMDLAAEDAGSTTHQALVSDPVVVSPPAATLEDSTLDCADVNGGVLLPGEQVSCDLDVVNTPGHEDAGSVDATVAVPGAVWQSGGLALGAGSAFFGFGAIDTVAAGADKAVTASFNVPLDALGGSALTGFASISGASTPSGDPIDVKITSSSLVVAPGPARLVTSSLVCVDTNGGLLLAGDDLTCAVNVAPTLGYEDVQGASAVVDIPSNAQWVSGGDDHDASTVSFAASSLGDVAAGAIKAVGFHLRVATGTAPNTVLHPIGSISATSVPLGGAVQQALNGNFLTVGQVVVVEGETPPPDQPIQIVTPPIVTPPAAAPKTYKLKAKTIRFVMRSGHKRKNHLWHGSKRRFAFVKKFIVRTPAISGKVVKKVTVPKKGKWAPKHGVVKIIKKTRIRYTLKKGVNPGTVRDRFHYTVTDTNGKKVTGTVVVSHKKG